MATRLLHAITDACTSRWGKYITIVAWLLLTALMSIAAPKLANLYDNSGGQDIPAQADSQAADRLLLKEFPSAKGIPAILVFTDQSGLSASDEARLKDLNTWLNAKDRPAAITQIISVFTVPQAKSQLVSADNTTMTILVQLSGSGTDTAAQDAVKAIRTQIQQEIKGVPLVGYLTGPAGIAIDAGAAFSNVDLPLLLTTVGLVFVLLVILYRSPILALLPLLAVGVAQQVITGVLGFAAQGGLFSVNQMSTSIATVLLFGAGTDYSIFIASRFREELHTTQDKHVAMQNTMHAVGEAVTSSAGTVIVSLLTLLGTAISLYSSLGPTLAITIAVMLVAGLTLVPAVIVLLGRFAYWPLRPRYQEQQAPATAHAQELKGFWGRLGTWTARHRIVAVVGSTLLLVVFALGNIGSVPSFSFLSSFRIQNGSTRGYALLQKHFPAGSLAPTTALIQLNGSSNDAYQHLAQLDHVITALQQVPGVATVEGPTRPDGKTPAIDPQKLQDLIAQLPAALKQAIRSGKTPSFQAPTGSGQPSTSGKPPVTGQPTTGKPTTTGAPSSTGKPPFTGQPSTGKAPVTGQPPTTGQPAYSPQLIAAIGAYAASMSSVSPDNTTVKLTIIFKDDPYALPAINRIDPLRSALQNSLHAQNLTQVTTHMEGQTAQLADTLVYNQHDIYFVVPLVLVFVAIVLALLLRSLIAPLYLLAAVTLNYLAAIGVCGFVFQKIQGQDGFNYAIPLYTFIFLVALGVDYTIFLMSRIREESFKRGLDAGVPFAVARTGGVITSAGLILAGTFAVLTTLPLNVLYQLGVCVAVGILLDTFVVRGFLVPGLVLLLGKWNWWPSKNRPANTASTQEPLTEAAETALATGKTS